MKRRNFIRDPLVEFKKTGEPVTRSQIYLAIPEDFAGKEDFVQFYLQHNGGVFKSFAYFYRDTFQKIGKMERNMMGVFNLLRIARNGSSDVDYELSMQGLREVFLRVPADAKVRNFLKSRIPFAGDGSGNYYWIKIPSGHIQFLDHESVGEGLVQPIEIAPTFEDFIANFRSEPREGDLI